MGVGSGGLDGVVTRVDGDGGVPLAPRDGRTIPGELQTFDLARRGDADREADELGLELRRALVSESCPVGVPRFLRDGLGVLVGRPRARRLAVLLVALREVEERARRRIDLLAVGEL